MEWASDSPDLWASDSRRPALWAPDSHGHLTLGRAVELFLAAKAAEGASPRTTEWYLMILVRLVRSTHGGSADVEELGEVGDGVVAGGVHAPQFSRRVTG
jgi:hypothetical protein